MQTVNAPLVPQIYGDQEATPDKSRYGTSAVPGLHLSGKRVLSGVSRSPALVIGLLRKGHAQHRSLEWLGGQGSFGFSMIWSVRTANSKKFVKV